MTKLNSKQLRKVDAQSMVVVRDGLKRNPVYLILENIYDTYNIGGLFRLADGLGVTSMYLCGETTPPPNNRIHKASCGTYKVVPWKYFPTVSNALDDIRSKISSTDPLTVVAIEQSATSIPYHSFTPTFPIAVVVGNETTGVTQPTLSLCDHVLEIPMWGINMSLNVIVSAGIVSYHLVSSRSQ
ncbi:MAG: TrmH family RNA methyltransferase [bacterium]